MCQESPSDTLHHLDRATIIPGTVCDLAFNLSACIPLPRPVQYGSEKTTVSYQILSYKRI